MQQLLEDISSIDFFETITREYRVAGEVMRVPAEAAVDEGVIGLVSDFAFKWVNRRLFPWAQIGR